MIKNTHHKDLLKLLKCCLVFLQQTLHLFAVDFEFLNVRFTCLFGHGFEVMELLVKEMLQNLIAIKEQSTIRVHLKI